MHWALQPVSTGTSTQDIVSLADMKLHLRLPSSSGSDDDAIRSYMNAAKKELETRSRRSFFKDQFDLALDRDAAPGSDDALEIPVSPLSRVLSIKSYDTTNGETTLSTADYEVDTYSEPGRVFINSGLGATWPSSLRKYNAVIVRVEAGYSTAASGVPDPIVQALKALTAAIYENRGDVPDEMPSQVEAFLAEYRLPEIV